MRSQHAPRIDPIDLKVVWDMLISGVNAASRAEQLSAFSTAVTEANDFGCTLLDSRGRLVATSDFGLPSFCLMSPVAVQQLLALDVFATARDGDVFICNDPWLAAAQISDLLVIKPLIDRGKITGFATSVAHNPDIGGVRGWFSAGDVFEEGLLIPPLKLLEEGAKNETFWAILAMNSRIPEQTLGDVEAQIVAVETIASRTQSILSEQERRDLDTWSDEVVRRSEQLMRTAVAAVPDGVYSAERELTGRDFGGADPAEEVVLAVDVTIADDELTADFSRSSPQVGLPVNAVATFTRAYTVYATRLLLTPNVPHNEGFALPIHTVVREGTVLAARRPHPCLARHIMGHHVPDLIHRALAPGVPEDARAESGSGPAWTLLFTPLEGRYKDVPRLFGIAGGTGASAAHSGQTVMYPVNIGSVPVEVLEQTLPVRFLEKRVLRGSGGDGASRGGDGQRLSLEVLGPMIYTLMGGHIEHPPRGLSGGGDGRPGRAMLNGLDIGPGSGRVAPGDVIVCETPGGGGVGVAR